MIRTEHSSGNRPAAATSDDPPMIAPVGPGPAEPVHGAGRSQAVVRTAEGIAVAQVKDGLTATVRHLLAAYADTLDVLDGLRVPPMVATRWHWWSRPNSPICLPRISWMLRSLTLWHIDRVLSGAERAFRRRSALGIAQAGEADALDAVTGFHESLPSRSRVLRIGVVVVAALVVAHVLAIVLVQLSRHGVGAGVPLLSANINQLLDSILGGLQLTSGSLGLVADALFKASPTVLLATAGLVSLSLYVILWPVASAFRLKRLLLNLHPQADSKLRGVPAAWSMTRSTGVYDLERDTFAALGARVPGEPPLDLLVSLPVPICWIALWVYDMAFVAGRTVVPGPTVVAGRTVTSAGQLALFLPGIIALLIPPAAMRLAWLAAAWRARNGRPRSTWLFGDDVSVPWRAKPVRCRSPLLIGWLSLILVYAFMIIGWIWWSTAHDLREVGRVYGVRRLRRMHPLAQALAAGPGALLEGLPALIVLSRAPRYLREAQSAAGLQRTVPRGAAWLVLIWPVLCVRLQRELNRLWQSEGMQIAR